MTKGMRTKNKRAAARKGIPLARTNVETVMMVVRMKKRNYVKALKFHLKNRRVASFAQCGNYNFSAILRRLATLGSFGLGDRVDSLMDECFVALPPLHLPCLIGSFRYPYI